MPRKPETPLPGADALRQMAEQDGSGLFAPQQPDPACAGLFLNRELSWLAFSRRVLQEAAATRLRTTQDDVPATARTWTSFTWCASAVWWTASCCGRGAPSR